MSSLFLSVFFLVRALLIVASRATLLFAHAIHMYARRTLSFFPSPPTFSRFNDFKGLYLEKKRRIADELFRIKSLILGAYGGDQASVMTR